MADLEQYSRINDVITGLDMKSRLYARTADPRGKVTQPDMDSADQQVIAFFNSKWIILDSMDIEVCRLSFWDL